MMPTKTTTIEIAAVATGWVVVAAAEISIFLQNPRLKPTKLCYLMRTEPNAKDRKRKRKKETTVAASIK